MSAKRRVPKQLIAEGPRDPEAAAVPRPFIMMTVFSAGMAVMVLELMGSRLIGPFYGVSLYVWASLITTALIALSLGYWVGGRLADRHTTGGALYLGILIAAALTCLLPVLRRPVLQVTAPLGVRLGSLTSAVLLFLPPIACLGIVAPYAVRLHARSMATLGGSAGTLYAVSTIGSVVGTVVTGFVLIPSFPMDVIIISLGVVLALVSLTFWIVRVHAKGIAATIVVVTGSLVGGAMTSPDHGQLRRLGVQILAVKETPYGQMKVMDSAGVRYLLVNGSFQGEVRLSTGRSTAPYIHLLAGVCREYAPDARRVLCIGLGAGTLPTLVQEPGVAVDAVDIDGEVIRAAKRFFGFQPGSSLALAEDGRRYLETATVQYDAILLDAFASEAIPEHLLTQEALAACERLLVPEGVLGINLVGYTEGAVSRVPRAIVKTAGQVFDYTSTWFIPQERADPAFGSVIIIASQSPLPSRELGINARRTAGTEPWTVEAREVQWSGLEQVPILTDGFNPLSAWNAPVDLAIRQQVLKYMPWELLTG